MQHSQSENVLGNQNNSWTNLKNAERQIKRSNTAQNLKYYVEEQKRLYQELPFMALPGMRRQSIQRERSLSGMKGLGTGWGSFGSSSSLARPGEDQSLLSTAEVEYTEPGYTRPLVLSCCVALLSAFQFGYNTNATGAVSPDAVFPGHTSFEWSLCVSAFPFGGPFGSLIAGKFLSQLGRTKTLMFNSTLFIAAGLIMALAPSIYILIVGRLLVGFASGMVTVVVPLYLGELAPPNLRGALGTGYQFGVVLGILLADFMAFPFSKEYISILQPGWRVLFGFTAIPAVIQVLLYSWLYESPRWLLTQNKPKDAAEILRKLRGTTDVYEEIDSICSASDQEGGTMSVGEVLRDQSIRYALVVGILLQIAQQFSGINVVFFFSNFFLGSIGLSDPLIGTTLVGLVNVISTGVALLLMDRAGRRPLLLWSCGGMFISAIVLTLAMMHVIPNSAMVSVVALMAYVWFFEIGLGPIPWLIVAEMFPAQPRTTAMSLATMVNLTCSFIIGIGFPSLQLALGNYSFVPFAVVLILSFVFTLKFVPETKGKTLEEIQEEFQQK